MVISLKLYVVIKFTKHDERILAPRYLWEGGNCKEGFLRLAKPTLNKITRNWKLNLHKDLLKFTSIRQTLHDAGLEDILHSNKSSKKYICYKTLSQIVTILLNKRPISILFFKDEFFVHIMDMIPKNV